MVKISKGNLHSGKATVVYTLQFDTAREPGLHYVITLPKIKITLADFHPHLAVSSLSVNGV